MKEIYLTDIETEILAVFVKRKILESDPIIRTLSILIEKVKQTKGKD